MVAGLRSIAKAMELPPAPTVRAPALDPTCERLGVRLPGATLPTGTPEQTTWQTVSVRPWLLCLDPEKAE